MRIPLVRLSGDERPVAWWEWLFIPITTPVVFVVLLVLAVISVPVELISRLRSRRHEKQLHRQFNESGRYMEWAAVEAKLITGEGTLIVEHHSPKGPIREWWTEDDLVTAAPVPLPTSLQSLPDQNQLQLLHAYANACSTRYTDTETGAAHLTAVPVPLRQRLNPSSLVVVNLGGGLMTAIVLVTGRELATKYPQGKVVTLLHWSIQPIVFAGDAEAIFLAEPKSP
jgi:hypothetical protein